MNLPIQCKSFFVNMQRAIDSLIRISLYACEIIVVIMMLLITIEVVLRSFFHASLLLTDEMCGYFLVAITFFGISYCLRSGALLRIKFILFSLPQRIRIWVDLVYDLLALIFALIVTYELFRLAWGSYRLKILAPTLLETPLYIPELAMPIGMSLLVLGLLSELGSDITRILENEPDS